MQLVVGIYGITWGVLRVAVTFRYILCVMIFVSFLGGGDCDVKDIYSVILFLFRGQLQFSSNIIKFI
jgi:hypothetical protein